jgi:hypothetical protein
MLVANPIYDVVFKYLMNDEKVAKLILSSITGLKIKKVDFKSQEIQEEIRESLTVLHLDFVAKVEDENKEEKLILIELQKAKLPSDIMRFRRYLGNQYADSKNVYESDTDDSVDNKGIPILTIYFLGHKLNTVTAPIIKVNREYIDVLSKSKIEAKEDFIESLTHDSVIIQIPYLDNRKRSSIETV